MKNSFLFFRGSVWWRICVWWCVVVWRGVWRYVVVCGGVWWSQKRKKSSVMKKKIDILGECVQINLNECGQIQLEVRIDLFFFLQAKNIYFSSWSRTSIFSLRWSVVKKYLFFNCYCTFFPSPTHQYITSTHQSINTPASHQHTRQLINKSTHQHIISTSAHQYINRKFFSEKKKIRFHNPRRCSVNLEFPAVREQITFFDCVDGLNLKY